MHDREKNLYNLLGVVANKFSELDVLHEADVSEAVFHIHALQNIVLARTAMRELLNR